MTPANTKDGLLAVEGGTDLHFVMHLCRVVNPALESRFSRLDCHGRQGVLDAVGVLINSPNFAAVGFFAGCGQ